MSFQSPISGTLPTAPQASEMVESTHVEAADNDFVSSGMDEESFRDQMIDGLRESYGEAFQLAKQGLKEFLAPKVEQAVVELTEQLEQVQKEEEKLQDKKRTQGKLTAREKQEESFLREWTQKLTSTLKDIRKQVTHLQWKDAATKTIIKSSEQKEISQNLTRQINEALVQTSRNKQLRDGDNLRQTASLFQNFEKPQAKPGKNNFVPDERLLTDEEKQKFNEEALQDGYAGIGDEDWLTEREQGKIRSFFAKPKVADLKLESDKRTHRQENQKNKSETEKVAEATGEKNLEDDAKNTLQRPSPEKMRATLVAMQAAGLISKTYADRKLKEQIENQAEMVLLGAQIFNEDEEAAQQSLMISARKRFLESDALNIDEYDGSETSSAEEMESRATAKHGFRDFILGANKSLCDGHSRRMESLVTATYVHALGTFSGNTEEGLKNFHGLAGSKDKSFMPDDETPQHVKHRSQLRDKLREKQIHLAKDYILPGPNQGRV